MRWLVAGIGDITRKRVLPAILAEPRSTLVGILTRTPAKAEPYGVPAFTDINTALQQCDADAVYVATPVALHAEQTIASFRAGRHVLCEKPMAMNHPEACGMQAAAKETGRTLGVAYYRRMYPQVNRAKELIETGAIGRPVFACATAHDWFHPTDGFRAWLIDPAVAGGGPLYDIASHRIDLMNYLFGAPSRATGQLSTLVHPTAVEDNATVLIEYDLGVRGVVDVRWHSRVQRDEFRIRGTEGEIDMSPLNSGRLMHTLGQQELAPHTNLHFPGIENFVSAVLHQTPLRATGESSLPTAWIIDQVTAACRS